MGNLQDFFITTYGIVFEEDPETLDSALHNAKDVEDQPYNAKVGVDECFWKGIVCSATATAAPSANTTNNSTTDNTPTSRASPSPSPGSVTEIHWGYQVAEDGELVSRYQVAEDGAGVSRYQVAEDGTVVSTTNSSSSSGTTNTTNGSGDDNGGGGGRGHLSSTIRLLRSSLTLLDVSHNHLGGTIPEELYALTQLQKLFVYQNHLEGTLSTLIGDLDAITHLYLSHNNFGGTIPLELKSDQQGIRPLEYFNIYSNQFTGTIPDHLRLRNLFYSDVGRNLLTGKLPSDLGESFVSLRHLHLDHNDFRGTIPSSYNKVGNGRLESFSLNHNRLTGTVPGDREHYNKLVQYTLHENRFSRIQINNCRLEVPQGECVEFRADCNICRCNGFLNLCDRTCHRN